MSRPRSPWPFFLLLILAVALRCGSDITTPAEGLPSHIVVIAGDGQSGVVGQPLADSLVVRITDSKDRPVLGQPIQFSPLGPSAAGSLVPDTAVTDTDGQAWSKWVLGTVAGPAQVQARVLGHSGSGNPVQITFSAIAQPGPPDTLYALGGEGQSAIAGSQLAEPLLVQVQDEFGNPLGGQVIAWSADSGGSVSEPSTSTDAEGRAAIHWQLGPKAGVQTSEASITGVAGSTLGFTATALPGAPAAVERAFGDGQTAPVGAALTDSVVARVVDAFGNGVPGRSLSWVLGGGGGSVVPGTSTTDSDGQAFTRWSLGPNAGQQILNAVVSGFAPIPFTATAVALQPATIQAASNTTLVGTAGLPVSPAPSASVRDVNGNPIGGVTVSFTVVAGGGQVSDGTNQGSIATVATNASGIATVAFWTLGPLAGSGLVEARATGPAGPLAGSPVSFSALGVPGAPAQLAFLQGPGTTAAGQPIVPPVTVAIEDASGNIVQNSTASVQLALGNNPPGGTLSGTTTVAALNGVATFGGLSLDLVGNGYTLVASSATGIHPATTAEFGVVAGAAARLGMVTQPSATAASSLAFSQQPAARLEDGFGNPVSQSNVAVTATIASGGGTLGGKTTVGTNTAGVAAFTDLSLSGLAGPRTLLFSAAGLQTITSATVSVVAGPAASLVLSAGDGQSAPVGTAVPVPPSVKVSDGSGNPVAGVAVAFDVATGGGSITGATALSDASGIATVGSWKLGSARGSNTLTATAPGLTGSPVIFTATARFAYTALGAGAEFSCGISTAGTAYCWGRNDRGQIGNGSFANQSAPVPVAGGLGFGAIGVGYAHACGITATGAAFCWGENADGQLGDGSTTDRLTPTPVSGGLQFSSIDGGESHSCALTPAGVAYCWGRNEGGRLGDGTNVDRRAPTPVAGGIHFVSLALGGGHTCGLSTSGTVYCWGNNGNGQLGVATRADHSSPVAVPGAGWTALTAGEDFSCAIGAGGHASCWGRNDKGQLGDGSKSDRSLPTTVSGGLSFTLIDAGDRHTCAVTAAGTAYCWGQNAEGELGDGSNSERHTPTLVQTVGSFALVNAGGLHTLAFTPTGIAYGWGRDASGQLGTGTSGDKLRPVLVIEP